MNEPVVIHRVKQYLEAIQSVIESCDTGGQRNAFYNLRWSCVEDLLLKEGREFTYAPKPKNIKYGPMKECFRNAYLLAERRPDMTYVEGFANNIIPMWHAWCSTLDGFVVDPTWRDEQHVSTDSADYFGIPFQLEYVSKVMVASGEFGILYSRHGPLTVPPSTFL